MPLDSVGRRYAENLFHRAFEEINQKQNSEVIRITAKHTSRHTIQSGMYFSAYGKVLAEGISLRGQARVDSLLKAYEKSGLALDEPAMQEIKQETMQYCQEQQHHAVSAICQKVSQPLKDAIKMMTAKLTHALYFRETGKILTREHEFQSSAYQPQRGETQEVTSFFTTLLPNMTVGTRTNIKEYGERFRYRSGYKEHEDFFIYAAQFGHGLILWGIVCGPGIERPGSGPLSSAPWLSGGCGPGGKVEQA
jgi:hypothetical protein